LDRVTAAHAVQKWMKKMKDKVDEFVAAFFPEMQRIQSLKESDLNKIRMSENWLRARLEKFAGDVREDCGRKSRAREGSGSGTNTLG
jgi:hypothetical protein